MITSKQRSYLKGMANRKKSLTQLGKEGISQAFLSQMNALFEAHELVKVNVLNGCALSAKEAAMNVMDQTDAQFVQAIGNTFTLYRRSVENPKIELPKKKGNL